MSPANPDALHEDSLVNYERASAHESSMKVKPSATPFGIGGRMEPARWAQTRGMLMDQMVVGDERQSAGRERPLAPGQSADRRAYDEKLARDFWQAYPKEPERLRANAAKTAAFTDRAARLREGAAARTLFAEQAGGAAIDERRAAPARSSSCSPGAWAAGMPTPCRSSQGGRALSARPPDRGLPGGPLPVVSEQKEEDIFQRFMGRKAGRAPQAEASLLPGAG